MVNKFSQKDINSYNWLRAIPHYLTIYFALYPFYKLWYKIKIYGRENIPKKETLLIAANHLSNFDPTVISLAMRKPVAYMSKEELFEVPILKQFILMYGAFSVNRQKLEISTIKTALGIIKKGWYVGMFPEGTRGKDQTIKQVHKGLGYLAKSTKTRILPLAIIGSDTKHGPITVKIGEPIDWNQDPDQIMEEWLIKISALTGFKCSDKLLETYKNLNDNQQAQSDTNKSDKEDSNLSLQST